MTETRKETPEWKKYIADYNTLYCVHGYSDAECEAALGPEPPRYEEELPRIHDSRKYGGVKNALELDKLGFKAAKAQQEYTAKLSEYSTQTVADDFDEQLEMQRELDAVYDDAAGRGGYG